MRGARGAVRRGGLRAVFHAAHRGKLAADPQRMVGVAMAPRHGADARLIERDDLFEQAHAPLVGKMALDPGAVEHGAHVDATPTASPSRYSITRRPCSPRARKA